MYILVIIYIIIEAVNRIRTCGPMVSAFDCLIKLVKKLTPSQGKALDYESRDSRFDPVHVQSFFCHFPPSFNFLWNKGQERHDATLLLRSQRLPTTAHSEYVELGTKFRL